MHDDVANYCVHSMDAVMCAILTAWTSWRSVEAYLLHGIEFRLFEPSLSRVLIGVVTV